MVPGVNLRSYCFFFSFGLGLFNCLFTQSFRYVQDTSIKLLISKSSNVYVLETDRKIPDQSDLQIIEQTGNTYKLEVNSVMEVLSNLEKQGVQVKNITQIHKTLEDVYNGFIQEASL